MSDHRAPASVRTLTATSTDETSSAKAMSLSGGLPDSFTFAGQLFASKVTTPAKAACVRHISPEVAATAEGACIRHVSPEVAATAEGARVRHVSLEVAATAEGASTGNVSC
jgi:hypothetical protein